MTDALAIKYQWRGHTIRLKRVHIACAYCGADLLRSTTRAKRKCFCNNAEALRYRYENGLIDPNAIVKAAHGAMAAIQWRRGVPNPKVRGENNPAKRPASRAKISAAKLEHNWMRGRTGKLHHGYMGGKIWWRGKDWDAIKLRVRQRDGFMCVKCDMPEWEHIERFSQPLHVDHIIMYRISHDNSMQNLQTLCVYHHAEKIPEEKTLMAEVIQILAS